MSIRTIFFAGAVLLSASICTWASGIPDPSMGVEADILSDPVSGGIRLSPITNGGGTFPYFNDLGVPIFRLEFFTTIPVGLNQEEAEAAFGCNATGAFPNPFFLNCDVDYNGRNGEVAIRFFGVNPFDDDGLDGQPGDQEGIGIYIPECIEGPICFLGHFVITLNDNFSLITDPENRNGGWEDPFLFPNGPAQFTVQINAPEPATFVLGGAALLLGFAIRRRRIRV